MSGAHYLSRKPFAELPLIRLDPPFPAPTRSLAVLIPALNEEAGIGTVLRGLPTCALARAGIETHAIVLDGHSTDRTRELATAMGATVVTQRRAGKGSALREVIPELAHNYAVMIDADGSYPTEAIPQLVRLLEAGCEVVSGSRLSGPIAPGAMTEFHRLGNRMLTWLANLLYPSARTTDVCTGLWAFHLDVLQRLRLTADRFDFEADLYTEAALRGLRHAEIPIRYARRAGAAKLSWLDSLRIARTLLMKRLRQPSMAPARSPGEAHVHPESAARRSDPASTSPPQSR